MIHAFGLLLLEEFSLRKILNVYNLDTFNISCSLSLSLSFVCLWLETDF